MDPSNALRSLLSHRWFPPMRDLPVADDLRKILASDGGSLNERDDAMGGSNRCAADKCDIPAKKPGAPCAMEPLACF